MAPNMEKYTVYEYLSLIEVMRKILNPMLFTFIIDNSRRFSSLSVRTPLSIYENNFYP